MQGNRISQYMFSSNYFCILKQGSHYIFIINIESNYPNPKQSDYIVLYLHFGWCEFSEFSHQTS